MKRQGSHHARGTPRSRLITVIMNAHGDADDDKDDDKDDDDSNDTTAVDSVKVHGA